MSGAQPLLACSKKAAQLGKELLREFTQDIDPIAYRSSIRAGPADKVNAGSKSCGFPGTQADGKITYFSSRSTGEEYVPTIV